MNKYLLKTSACMKPYNHKKWWIMGDIISQLRIEAKDVNDALKKYKNIVEERFGVTISENALKNKEPMFVDVDGEAKQNGYVITASTNFEDRSANAYSRQYIELWVEILTVVDTEF